MRWSLFAEIVALAFDTLRNNKMRSALTILGIVIGITSIVGVTALLRGLDESFRELIRDIGPDTIFVQKFSGISARSGADFTAIMKRPNIIPADADAIEEGAPSIQVVDVCFGCSGGTSERLYFGNLRTKPLIVFGTTERWPSATRLAVQVGRFFTNNEVVRRQRVVVLGQTAAQALFSNRDPIGKQVRIRLDQYTVIGVMAKRSSPGGFNIGADDFVIVPFTAYQKQYGIPMNLGRGTNRSVQLSVVPREGVPRAQAMQEVETVMRARHGLRLDEPNDFDMVTQDQIMSFFDTVTQAIFLGLVALSSIALMVGGIGVMSIMTISVTERTREIGVRKALGARRVEILWQFLLEAVFLTSVGGLLGILFGTSIGFLINALTGFPISMPWWSFAIGIGFSASVGLFFGMVPAIRASRLDPIEALRYE